MNWNNWQFLFLVMIFATDPLLFLLEKYYEITLSQIVHTIKSAGHSAL